MNPRQPLRRFFRTPKGLLFVILAFLAALASWAGSEIGLVVPGVAASVAAAMLIDAPILRMREGKWVFPSGALVTGLLVAMVLTPHEPWYVPAATSAIGVVSKYLVRVRTANVFNPTALGLVVTYYVFNTGQSWWGALPELPPLALIVLVGAGVFIADRINKIPLVLVFLGSYYLLFSVTAFLGDPAEVAELYRAPDLHAALFFAFFMLTDPPTSPARHRDQLVFGVIVAVASYAAFEWLGALYYLLAGLLVANAWEAWRRARARAQKAGRAVVA